MGQTLENSIYLPDEGERNCYSGLASNWRALDTLKGSYSAHAINVEIHVTATEKETWNGKADASALTAHTGDTTIHVTAEDKQAWNGKADASALTAHTGDTTIHVTSADKAKWDTVTSKANDSDVVHKSGYETSTGFKQFANIRLNNSIKAINLDSTTTDLDNCYSDFAPYGENKGGNIQYYYCNTDAGTANISNLPAAKAFFLTSITTRLISNSLYVKQTLVNSTNKTYTRYCNNGTWGSWVNETDKYVTIDTAQTISGNKTFSSINGVEPSSLSLPNFNNGIDISGYVTNLSGYPNDYVAPANGFISISATGTELNMLISGADLGVSLNRATSGSIKHYIPILKGQTVRILVIASALEYVKFYPCQGNI